MELSKAHPSFITGTAHHQVDKEDDNRTLHEESSEAVAPANMTQLIHQTMTIDCDLIYSGLIIARLPINCSDFIGKIRLLYYDTGNTITMQNPNKPQKNWEAHVFLMKVEFCLQGTEKRISTKAAVSSKFAR